MKQFYTKNNIIYICIMMMLGSSSYLKAQFQARPNIHSFTSAQKTELANLIIDYIDVEVLRMHCDYSEIMQMTPGTFDIHDDFNFLPFHRTYLERLEDFLIEQGHPEYVPLPGWAATTMPNPNGGSFSPYPPIQFNLVDPDCGNDGCTDQAGTCANPQNWGTHQVPMPPYLTLPPVTGLGNDLCDWQFIPSQFSQHIDNSGGNGLSRNIESPWHNDGHVGTIGGGDPFGGVMSNFRSPAAAIFWLWHAAVDDKWKEWEANCPQSPMYNKYDLYMKDRDFVVQHFRDRGEEPNIDEGPMWVSNDIWIRQNQDGSHHHENPEYHFTSPNYAYVQVRNRGVIPSPAGEQLSLYWTKAGSALSYPNDWNGTTFVPNSTIPLSGLVGTVTLPSIAVGDSYIAEIPWVVPNPDDYQGLASIPGWWDNNPQHFCLLAIKESSTGDPHFNNSTNIHDFVSGNNNVVWRNISVVDLDPTSTSVPPDWADNGKLPIGATILVGDQEGLGGIYDLEFTNPRYVRGNAVTEEAEVRVTLDEPLWEIWEASGFEAEGLDIVRDEKYQVIIKEVPARLKNLQFQAEERALMKVEFNFIANQLSGQEHFVFDVFQRESDSDIMIGGERYEIYIPGKEGFYADAGGDKEISEGENAYLNAYDIGQPAVYNWYDSEGNLIYEGKDFTVSPEVTEKYQLEVITTLDGLVDYDEVEVKVREFELSSLSPNPANEVLNINYKADKANSAYITLMQAYGGSYNFILDTQQIETTLNIASIPSGYYTAILVCDGQPVASQSVLVQ